MPSGRIAVPRFHRSLSRPGAAPGPMPGGPWVPPGGPPMCPAPRGPRLSSKPPPAPRPPPPAILPHPGIVGHNAPGPQPAAHCLTPLRLALWQAQGVEAALSAGHRWALHTDPWTPWKWGSDLVLNSSMRQPCALHQLQVPWNLSCDRLQAAAARGREGAARCVSRATSSRRRAAEQVAVLQLGGDVLAAVPERQQPVLGVPPAITRAASSQRMNDNCRSPVMPEAGPYT